MRVLVTGANGFIARQIVAELLQQGHEVVAGIRNPKDVQRLPPKVSYLLCDFNRDTKTSLWEARLTNIDAVINCVGILQQRRRESIQAIHTDAPIALFKACETKKIKRVIQISAEGAEETAATLYGRTKNAADQFLQNSQLDWAVIRPSLVYASGSYGGTSFFRGLCGLPYFLPIVGEGTQPFQPIHLDDLAKAIVILLEKKEALNMTLDASGPEVITQQDFLTALRNWLGFSKASFLKIPLWCIKVAAKVGDIFSRGPVNSTALGMMQTAKVYDPKPFAAAIGFPLQTFQQGLEAMPSYVQDRWHARLYFLRPLLRIVLAFMWIASGVVPYFVKEASLQLLMALGLNETLTSLLFYGSTLLDFVLGLALLFSWQVKRIASIQIGIMLLYTIIISIFLPLFWLDPFGSVLKNLPLIVATWIVIALEDVR